MQYVLSLALVWPIILAILIAYAADVLILKHFIRRNVKTFIFTLGPIGPKMHKYTAVLKSSTWPRATYSKGYRKMVVCCHKQRPLKVDSQKDILPQYSSEVDAGEPKGITTGTYIDQILAGLEEHMMTEPQLCINLRK